MQGENDPRRHGKKKGGGGGKGGETLTKQCADCEKIKTRDGFSKTQWSRDERRCIVCIEAGERKREES